MLNGDKLEIDYYFNSLNYYRIQGDDSDNNRKIRIFIGIRIFGILKED
ncbi:hypothetical protein BFRIG_02510 [Peribacillus frigoritolerans]